MVTQRRLAPVEGGEEGAAAGPLPRVWLHTRWKATPAVTFNLSVSDGKQAWRCDGALRLEARLVRV